MAIQHSIPNFEFMRALLENAALHFKLVFGLGATRPEISYLGAFSFRRHIAYHDELSLTPQQEEHAFASMEHCATYLAMVQIHTVLETIHVDPFHIQEPDIAAAFQLSRLTRNAFAHNPFAPVWDIRNAWRDMVFTVPDVISLNTSGLDGSPVRREHYGGPLAILRFIQYANSVITLRANQVQPK